MSMGWIVALVILAVLILLLVCGILIYNRLQQMRVKVEEAASGIDDFQNTEFSGDVGKHFTVQCEHAFFVSGIVIDVIAEPAFAPDAWIGFQKDDFPLVFIGNFTITIHNFFVLSLVLPAWKLAALQVPVQTGTT